MYQEPPFSMEILMPVYITNFFNWLLLHKQQLLIKSLAMSYFHMGNPTLSSALSGFTSEFEMDSGGSKLLWSPGKTLLLYNLA